MHMRYLSLLIFLLIVKCTIMAFVILNAGIGLGPDEAQYWTWSKDLDWGYYSKPPGIAWEIWLGTFFFGDTELGVRSGPLLIGSLLPLLVYYMARGCQLAPRTCFWAGILMAFTPLGILSSFLAITDGGMMLFWTATCVYLASRIQEQRAPNYMLVGLVILCGALFKWPIYFLWLFILLAWIPIKNLRSPTILIGSLISILGLMPSLYWNSMHEWATFKHVGTQLTGGNGEAKLETFKNFFGFIGAQVGLVSPILYVLLILSLYGVTRIKSIASSGILFCCMTSIGALIMGSIAGIFMKIQGNWAIFAYGTSFVVISWYVFEIAGTTTRRWFGWGLGISTILVSLVLSIPTIQSHSFIKEVPIPYRTNPFRHNVGWDKLADSLIAAGYDPERNFVFSHTYQTTSILSFYGPKQKRAYFFNLDGRRKNQFSFWPTMEETQKGKNGYFVVIENIPQITRDKEPLIQSYTKELTPYFKKVSLVGDEPLFFSYGEIVKGVLIFECSEYNGDLEKQTTLY